MAFTLRVQNYRGLRNIAWSPDGVCALVGPNGSGKTTLLDVIALLGDALDRGLTRALEQHGGLADVRSLAVPESEAISFDIVVGELSLRVIPTYTAKLGFRPWERMQKGHELVVLREAGADDATVRGVQVPARDRLAASIALEQSSDLDPLGNVLARYRLYGQYDVTELRRRGSEESTERRLDRRGNNVFSLLRNWRDRSDDSARVEFVLGGLRELFPDFFDGLDFAKVQQSVGAEIRLRPYNKLLSTSLAPDGWFVALLHLSAVASTNPGDVIAIDEPENALHPHAIKVLIERMREWSTKHGVTILLATHSPVIIDAFRDCPDQLFVMEPGRETLPVALSTLKDPDWLAHFALGDLYARDEFGAPRR